MDCLKLTLPSDLRYLPVAVQFVRETAREFGFAGHELSAIELGVEESVTNVVGHAFTRTDDGHFDIVISTHTLEHLRKPAAALAEMKRVSKDRLIVVVPRQRAFKYTLDEHINFYPDAASLVKEIGEEDYVCEDLDGDWFFEANLRGPYSPR